MRKVQAMKKWYKQSLKSSSALGGLANARCATVAILGAGLLFPMAANAQEEQTEKQGKYIEEIIVYSQKGAQGRSSQDVPSAITVVDENLINVTNSIDLTDVGRLAPNVQLQPVSTFPSYANFTIRGLGVNNSVRTVDPSVNVVIDGMALGFQVGTVLDTFDLESIEILRGPQGIMFGRNTTGGAVSLRTARPSSEFRVKAKATVGSYGRVDLSGSLEGPLGGDKLRGKIAVMYRSTNGFFKDENGGTTVAVPSNPSGLQPSNMAENQVASNMLVIKPTFVFELSDNFEITVFGQYMESDGGGAATQLTFPSNATVSGTAIRDVFGFTPPAGKFNVNVNIGEHDIKAWHLIGEANWDLGHGVITSISAYRDIDYVSSVDLDGSPFPLLEFPNNEEAGDQFSQEIRYASKFSDMVDFVIGGYYFTQTYSTLERRQVNLSLFFEGDFTQDQETFAVFANANIHFSDRWALTLGGRYTDEEKTMDLETIALCTGGGFTGCNPIPLEDSHSWSNFSPKVGIQFTLSDDILMYASWTKGFRSGNYFSRIVTTPATLVSDARQLLGPTKEETVASYELGLKSTLLDRTLQLNLVGFHTEYDDIQRTIAIPGSNALQALRNAAKATINGIEFESTWIPTEALRLEASIGWIDASYDRFEGRTDTDTLKFDRVPDFTLYLAGNYNFAVPSVPGDFTSRVSYAWRDDFFTDVANTPELGQDAYGLLDASLTYDSGSTWSLSVFGRNLTKSEYIDVAIGPGFGNLAWGGAPRTYGVELKVTFD